ncbi:hypothetical protein [Petroclostridium xylanilyticum]|jgi:hypothetical protein|uniref:hypothetical protein n=1 Tax=Petroclostridium xylanilyticum TaxID=1792311 RepID=UPI0012FFBDD2|nr:hypothetical protein [Petroclostridium xylanilyticum]
MSKQQHNLFIKECKEFGMSTRQIVGVTGLSRGIVEREWNVENETVPIHIHKR